MNDQVADSAQLIEELRETFEMFDTNKDGTICKEELKSVIEKVDINLTEDQFNELVDTLDRNGDDKIEFEEFVKEMSSKLSKVNRKKDLRNTFNYFDSDDSGSIERKELFMIMKRFQPSITEEDVAQIISTIDDDGSGKISFDEFSKLMCS